MKKLISYLVIFAVALLFGLVMESTLSQSASANSPPKITQDVVKVGCEPVALNDIAPIGSELIPIIKTTTAETRHAGKMVLLTQFKVQPNVVKRE